jgi:hypothetical protein
MPPLRYPSAPGSVNLIYSSSNSADGGSTIHKLKHSPYQTVSASQVSALGVTAYTRLHVPIITNADTIAREEGLVSYDQDSERLCYTDQNLFWRCMATTDDLPLAQDSVSAILLITNAINSTASAAYGLPSTGYVRLTDWTTTPPRIGSANWNNTTGVYTASATGLFQISVQASWRETQKNQGIRVLRLIHTDGITTTRTILCETGTNPSPNRLVNTVQTASAGVSMAPTDTLHVEVAQTSGGPKDVEGGATFGSSGTVLQIYQLR